jgi:hypothetical protein
VAQNNPSHSKALHPSAGSLVWQPSITQSTHQSPPRQLYYRFSTTNTVFGPAARGSTTSHLQHNEAYLRQQEERKCVLKREREEARQVENARREARKEGLRQRREARREEVRHIQTADSGEGPGEKWWHLG